MIVERMMKRVKILGKDDWLLDMMKLIIQSFIVRIQGLMRRFRMTKEEWVLGEMK
jgi:hypothetical protein